MFEVKKWILACRTQLRVKLSCHFCNSFWQVYLAVDAVGPASEVFQHRPNQKVENVPGLKIIAYDILIVGEDDTGKEAARDCDKK